MATQREDTFVLLRAGTRVRIRESHRSPQAGRFGDIASVDPLDGRGPYLVRFEDGTQFRYVAAEIESAQALEAGNHFFGKSNSLSPNKSHPHKNPSDLPRFGTRQK